MIPTEFISDTEKGLPFEKVLSEYYYFSSIIGWKRETIS